MISKTRGHIFKRGNTYSLQYNINGKRIVKSLNVTNLREAEKKRDEILTPLLSLNTKQDLAHVIAEAKKIYQPKKFHLSLVWSNFERHLNRIGSTDDTAIRLKYKWNNFLVWMQLKYSEISNLNEITKDIAKEYADVLLDTGISNKVYNETVNLLFRIIDHYKDEADIHYNPFDKANIPRRIKSPISRKEFTEEATLKLLESIPKIGLPNCRELEVLFHIGSWSGLRLKDAILLKWDDIDLVNHNIFVTPCKTRNYGTKVKIPIHPSLLFYLNRAREWVMNDYVLPNLAEMYLRNSDTIGKHIRKILEYNGYVNKKETKRLSAPCLYGFHSLRYTFVSACAKAGIPAMLVQEIVGHRNPAMTKHYTKFDDKYRQKAIGSVQLLPQSSISTLKDKIILDVNNLPEDKLIRVSEYLESLKL